MLKNDNIGNKIVGYQSFLITMFKVLGVTVLNELLLCFKKLIVRFMCALCSYYYKELKASRILRIWDVNAMYVAKVD